MFVDRRKDGTIYGCWTVKQWEGQEELPDDHPDVLAGPQKLAKDIVAKIRSGELPQPEEAVKQRK